MHRNYNKVYELKWIFFNIRCFGWRRRIGSCSDGNGKCCKWVGWGGAEDYENQRGDWLRKRSNGNRKIILNLTANNNIKLPKKELKNYYNNDDIGQARIVQVLYVCKCLRERSYACVCVGGRGRGDVCVCVWLYVFYTFIAIRCFMFDLVSRGHFAESPVRRFVPQ